MGLKKDTNTEGLRIIVGGQPLANEILYRHFPFGSFKTVVEVYRVSNQYDYTTTPITLYWGSACQDDIIIAYLDLKPQFLKPCAVAQFHNSISSFALDATKYVFSYVISLIIAHGFTFDYCPWFYISSLFFLIRIAFLIKKRFCLGVFYFFVPSFLMDACA